MTPTFDSPHDFLTYLREGPHTVYADDGGIYYRGEWSQWSANVQHFVKEGKLEICNENFLRVGSWRRVIEWAGENNPEARVQVLLDRYPTEMLSDIRAAIRRFGQCRKGGKVAWRVVQKTLEKWEKYSLSAVARGIDAYLGLADPQGKDERYCTGIIRNEFAKEQENPAEYADPIPPQPITDPDTLPGQGTLYDSQRVHDEFVRLGGESMRPEEASKLLEQIQQRQATAPQSPFPVTGG